MSPWGLRGSPRREHARRFCITEYKEVNGVKKPSLTMQVGLSGYDMLAYRQWLKNNKVEVEGMIPGELTVPACS